MGKDNVDLGGVIDKGPTCGGSADKMVLPGASLIKAFLERRTRVRVSQAPLRRYLLPPLSLDIFSRFPTRSMLNKIWRIIWRSKPLLRLARKYLVRD